MGGNAGTPALGNRKETPMMSDLTLGVFPFFRSGFEQSPV
jgi:hypothetical protein